MIISMMKVMVTSRVWIRQINWKAFENENGSSIMELFAINARHKINVYHTNNNDTNKILKTMTNINKFVIFRFFRFAWQL